MLRSHPFRVIIWRAAQSTGVVIAAIPKETLL
jgi:hypothetical protein